MVISPVNEIYSHYLATVQKHVPHARHLLKTDGHNEVFDRPKGGVAHQLGAGRVELLEADEEVVKTVRASGYSCTHGDIRTDHWSHGTYDALVDLSTIDHIEWRDVPTVLRNYHKWLKVDGIFVLFAWCSEDENQEQGRCGQFYFPPKPLLAMLKRRFLEIEHEPVYLDEIGPRYLLQFIGRSRPWWYLLESQERVDLATRLLTPFIEDARILDINCGSSPLLHSLPMTYRKFFGTDIYEEAMPTPADSRQSFVCMEDEDVYVTDMSVLICMGLVSDPSLQHESKTIFGSLRRMIDKQRPHTVLLEVATLFEGANFCELVAWAETIGYKIDRHRIEGMGVEDRTLVLARLNA